MLELRRGKRVAVAIGLTGGLMLGCSTPEPTDMAGEPRVSLAQRSVLADEPLGLRVNGVAPDAEVKVTVRSDGDGDGAIASAVFAAGEDGSIDLERDTPIRGAYSVASGFGLLWSLHSVSDPSQSRVKLEVTVSTAGKEVGTVTQIRRLQKPGVTYQRLTKKRDGVVGYLFEPPASETVSPRAAVVLIGGSEGGAASLPEAWLLAARGHPTLSLAYFKESGLPRKLEKIPIEYFGKALKRIGDSPSADSNALVPVGISRGGEAALLTASYLPHLAAGAVTVASIDVAAGGYPRSREPAWMWRDQPVPFADNLRDRWIDPGQAAIDVWKTRGPLLLICGKADQTLSSCDAADSIKKRLANRDKPPPIIAAYDKVGHEITAVAPGVIYEKGDNPDTAGEARVDAWEQLLQYLTRLEQK